MKNNSLFTLLFLAIAGITFTTLIAMRAAPEEKEEALNLGFPEEVTKILETSCFDCHTTGAKSEKALNKLNFSTWNDNSKGKKVYRLDEINEEIKEGNMPPKKYLNYYPKKKLTKEQAALISKWVKVEGDKLLK